MARKVFFSFNYEPDSWRASQVRQMGSLEGNPPCSDNDWEEITKGGDTAIETWIDGQLTGKSCAVVLIGSGTAGRKWIDYEIKQAWNAGKGLLGVYIHTLQDAKQQQSTKGNNPFDSFTLNKGKTKLSSVVKAYDPPYNISANVYSNIKDNIADWIEEAITIRTDYKADE
jgi:hypothetical protein